MQEPKVIVVDRSPRYYIRSDADDAADACWQALSCWYCFNLGLLFGIGS